MPPDPPSWSVLHSHIVDTILHQLPDQQQNASYDPEVSNFLPLLYVQTGAHKSTQ